MSDKRILKDDPRTAARRVALRRLIDGGRWAGNITAFAKDVKKPQPQVQDMLDGRKSFGEKIARQLESSAGVPAGTLDGAPGSNMIRESAVVYGSPISAEASLVGREWDKLQEPLKTHIRELIYMLVGKQVRHTRKKRSQRRYDTELRA